MAETTKASKQGSSMIKNLLALIILIVIIAGAGFVLTRNKNQQNTDEQPATEEKLNAVLSVLEGNPEVKKADSDEYVAGEEGFGLNTGDTVKTDESSRALILFADNSSVSLDFSTTITLTEIPTEEGGNVNLLQEAGQAWHRVEKLGKNENYQVQTPTAIAAVRGTKFVSSVSGDKSNIHTIESTVHVSPFIDGETIEGADVNAGDWVDIFKNKKEDYKKNNLKNFIAKFQEEKSKFFRYNECIDQYVPDTIKDADNLRDKFKLIRDKLKALKECEKILGEVATPTPTPSLTATPVGANITRVDASISNGKLKCSWDAKGTDISYYEYSAGTSSGSNNFANWKRSNGKSADIPGGLQNYSKYFCNVKVVSPWGNNQKSSGGILYDISSGAFISQSGSSTTVNFGAGSVTNWNAYSNVSYSNMAVADAEVKVSIKRTNGQYLNATGWQTGVYWFTMSCSQDGSLYCNTSGSANTNGFTGAVLNFEYRNKVTGKQFGTASATNTAN